MNSAFPRILFLVALALLGGVAFHYAPPSTTTYHIFPAFAQNHARMESFSDSGVTGNSSIRISQVDSTLHMDMTLLAPEGKDAWAGVGWYLQDANWLFMDTLFIRIRGTGFSEAQLKLLTFDPDHTVPTDRATYRQVLKEIAIRSEWQLIAIPTDHFYVPDWWYTQQNVSRKLDSKHLEKVYRLDLQPAANSPRNAPMTMDVQVLNAFGTSSRNLAILLGYWLVLMTVAIGTNPNRRIRKP